jgi:hypothetical protein
MCNELGPHTAGLARLYQWPTVLNNFLRFNKCCVPLAQSARLQGATRGTVAKAIEKGGTRWHLKEVGVLLL